MRTRSFPFKPQLTIFPGRDCNYTFYLRWSVNRGRRIFLRVPQLSRCNGTPHGC
nr:MAG TPA: peptidase [Caudoviricetes sp.]